MIRKILVVEDDSDIRENMKEFLDLEGYDTEVACDGHEAIKLLKDANTLPDVILLDLMMPIMDGFAFRAEQEKHPKLAQIPVLLMTANAQAEIHQAKIGAVGLIKKPLDLDTLSETLRDF